MRGTSKAPSARSKSLFLKRLRTRFGIPAALMAVLAMALPAGVSADPLGSNAEYSAPEAPTYPLTIVEGSDGNIWFTDPGLPNAFTNLKIGKVTPSGEVSLYTPGLSGSAWGIADGPDGNVWFTEPSAKKVGFVKPAEPTTSLKEFSVPGMATEPAFKSLITAGPDGNLWVTLGVNGIAKITPAGAVTEYKEGLNAGANVCSITAGPDGNVWFGDCGTTKAVGKITPAGAITEFSVVGDTGVNQPVSIVAGSDGRLWFPANKAANERLGAITTTGTVTYYKTPTTPVAFSLRSLTAAADGNVWATEASGENETQTVAINGEQGTFKIGFEGQETGWTGEGTLTSGSTSVTGITTTTGNISKNELISGSGIPANAKINACVPSNCVGATSITLSAAATASGKKSLASDLGIVQASGCGGTTNACSSLTIEEALGKLSTIGGEANVGVGGAGSPPNINRTITFEGKFTRTDVPLATCDGSKLEIENEETEEFEPTGGCTVKTTVESRRSRLFLIKPATGEMEEFSLKSATALQASVRANALASGPGGNLWYTSTGTPPAIGKFGLGVVVGPELTINKEGTGDGTVVSSPAGIECGGTCSAKFEENTKVTLTASPDSESLFVSWKGCETGGVNGRQCKVTMDKAKTVTAKFIQAYDVTVTRKGTGLGKVGSSPGGVLCLSNCSSTTAAFKEAVNVTLTATPSKNFTFAGWSGDCSGTGTCVLSALSADKSVEAEFVEVAKHLLTVTKSGGGQGTVKATQAGINCGATCTSMAAAYYQGTEVELTVTPGKGSSFGGWSTGAGTCTGTTNPCKVTMSAAKSVTAEFK